MKAVIKLDQHFVVDVEKLTPLLELLEEAEVYEQRWNPEREKEGEPRYLHYIYRDMHKSKLYVELLPDALLTSYRLAGKPKD